jgi:HK97 family phage prohead protease
MDRLDCGLIEVKFDATNAADMTFSGYGAVFGNTDSYGDVIKKGAFAETIKEAKSSGIWPAMLEQHGGWGISAGDMTPIGIWTGMAEDDTGLALEGKFAPTPRGQEMHALMKMSPRPAITGLSIGYIPEKWTNGDGKTAPRRTLEQIKLMEISPVTFPANGKARVQNVKSQDFTERDFEQILTRDAGFSRSEARIIINQGYKTLSAMRDAGSSELNDIALLLQKNIQIMKG